MGQDDIPQAFKVQAMMCGNCNNVHIVLFDEDEEPYAQFSLDKEGLDVLMAEIHTALGGLQ